ncbi:3-hydroxyanthranilate 3,4-dioxygenase [Wickerhamomyces ciferrii]|uniref:3-hydroxyanthranilate 3,4-dioxygenase n=1 Tax=Wickerhamomyces ciferrii (strain ATCC 14091 / BCRC 22168 / CBS 111 / JCM 3599 / NBRC 0793 / NRRL Y-1031 F-60-10) TaxID=1206466 RepID=K0KSE8_WICCF|nr:3-hydroxyanthranilate 3,4-dioxygenase [Wickerhamomyces ciferrii]CCH44253.1 3-hydroxyanthranilate 3,4-dioxygenase [Wickerhamomyces ciferrii]
MLPQPINIQNWIKENEHLLQPPVNNFCLHRGGFTVMIVGGPNERTDYHVNQTPEWFYMYKGDMTLKVVDDNQFRDITIREGDSFLLPGNTPHNPVRYADTIGIVVEQDRPEGVDDQIRWYCTNCSEIVHNITFHCTNLGTQVKEAILSFDGDIESRTCKKCGTLNYSKPQ